MVDSLLILEGIFIFMGYNHQHNFKPSDKEGYEVCADCGSYHSIAQVDPKIIYEEKEYWSYDEKRSKPEEQVNNLQCIDDCGISKVDRVMQFVPYGKRALEIACFPGVLLKRLLEKGYKEPIGIEPSDRYIHFICTQAPLAVVVHGYFPEVTKPAEPSLFDVIVGLDVFEHVDDYDGFMKEVHRLLVDGGTGIFMSPTILEDGLYRERDFDHPDEHCWIWTQRFLEPYLKSMFSEVKFARWIVGHELIIVKK